MPAQAIVTGLGSPIYLDQRGSTDAVSPAGYINETVSPISITPSVRALAITGQAPTVTMTALFYFAPSVGALAIVGQAPSVTAGETHSITPTVGALAVTGLAPTVTLTNLYYFAPSVGTLAITGQAPTVTSTDEAPQEGITVGDSIDCYEGLVHWRAGMGIGGIDAILYTGPV